MDTGDLSPPLRLGHELGGTIGPGFAKQLGLGRSQASLGARLPHEDEDDRPLDRVRRRREGTDLTSCRQGRRRDVQAADPHRVEFGSELLRDDGGGLGQEECVFARRRSGGASADERQALLARARAERAEQKEADGEATRRAWHVKGIVEK